MSEQRILHVVSATDDNYAQHLTVVFVSLLLHLSKDWKVRLYVIEGGLASDARNKLIGTVARHGAEVEFIAVNPADYAGFCEDIPQTYITQASFYRLFIPELLCRGDVSRAIYLDCDVIVRDDLSKLWRTDLEGRPLGAVRDLGGIHRLKDLSLPSGSKYFNSGVLLLDLRQWKERGLSVRVAKYAEANAKRLTYHDQDALNAVLHGEWLELPPRWNTQTNMLHKHPRDEEMAGSTAAEIAEDAAIIHFTGSSKPWHFDNTHRFKRLYYEYLALTDWRGYKPSLGLRIVLKRLAKLVLPPFVLALITETLERI